MSTPIVNPSSRSVKPHVGTPDHLRTSDDPQAPSVWHSSVVKAMLDQRKENVVPLSVPPEERIDSGDNKYTELHTCIASTVRAMVDNVGRREWQFNTDKGPLKLHSYYGKDLVKALPANVEHLAGNTEIECNLKLFWRWKQVTGKKDVREITDIMPHAFPPDYDARSEAFKEICQHYGIPDQEWINFKPRAEDELGENAPLVEYKAAYERYAKELLEPKRDLLKEQAAAGKKASEDPFYGTPTTAAQQAALIVGVACIHPPLPSDTEWCAEPPLTTLEAWFGPKEILVTQEQPEIKRSKLNKNQWAAWLSKHSYDAKYVLRILHADSIARDAGAVAVFSDWDGNDFNEVERLILIDQESQKSTNSGDSSEAAPTTPETTNSPVAADEPRSEPTNIIPLVKLATLTGVNILDIPSQLNKHLPPQAYGPIKYGLMAGKTDLDADYVRDRLVQVFGPMGIGWRIIPHATASRVEYRREERTSSKGEIQTWHIVTLVAHTFQYCVVSADGSLNWVDASTTSDQHDNMDEQNAYKGAMTSLMKQFYKLMGGMNHILYDEYTHIHAQRDLARRKSA